MEILEIKMAKIGLYKKKRDYVSITRTIDKQIKFFHTKLAAHAVGGDTDE